MIAEKLVSALKLKGLTLATAESCTGGLVAKMITDIPGSSAVFTCGFIAYANDIKVNLLGVDASLIKNHGAVSAEVAHSMAKAALEKSTCDFAVSITGIAGPTGGSAEKPIGLVYIGVANKDWTEAEKFIFTGSRGEIRAAAAEKALNLVLEALP